MNKHDLKSLIRVIPDYPKPGIRFQDLSPIYKNPEAVSYIISELTRKFSSCCITKLIGVESRGYIIGALLAHSLNIPFVMARKAGKTPVFSYTAKYNKEYGEDTIEIAFDDVVPGDNVLIYDDLLATGGTALAVADCCKQAGVSDIHFAFLSALKDLKSSCLINGRYSYYSLLDL